MTLCIAALANGCAKNPQIVFCSDMLMGDDYQSIETVAKSDVDFSETLAALYAGPWEDCANLKRVLLRTVRSRELTLDNYRGILSDGWKEFDAIPRSTHTPETDAQCIVAGFIEGEPRIIRVQKDGVDTFPFYTVAGIGGYHADTILCWRKLTQYSSLEQVLYFLYEAKSFGELCKDVGLGTIMEILTLNENRTLQVDLVMAEGLNIMEGWFRKKFGPQHVGYDLSFTPTAISRIKN